MTTSSLGNKLDYANPKEGFYHEKLAKQRLMKLKEIAGSDAGRWVNVYFDWLSSPLGELIVSERCAMPKL